MEARRKTPVLAIFVVVIAGTNPADARSCETNVLLEDSRIETYPLQSDFEVNQTGEKEVFAPAQRRPWVAVKSSPKNAQNASAYKVGFLDLRNGNVTLKDSFDVPAELSRGAADYLANVRPIVFENSKKQPSFVLQHESLGFESFSLNASEETIATNLKIDFAKRGVHHAGSRVQVIPQQDGSDGYIVKTIGDIHILDSTGQIEKRFRVGLAGTMPPPSECAPPGTWGREYALTDLEFLEKEVVAHYRSPCIYAKPLAYVMEREEFLSTPDEATAPRDKWVRMENYKAPERPVAGEGIRYSIGQFEEANRVGAGRSMTLLGREGPETVDYPRDITEYVTSGALGPIFGSLNWQMMERSDRLFAVASNAESYRLYQCVLK